MFHVVSTTQNNKERKSGRSASTYQIKLLGCWTINLRLMYNLLLFLLIHVEKSLFKCKRKQKQKLFYIPTKHLHQNKSIMGTYLKLFVVQRKPRVVYEWTVNFFGVVVNSINTIPVWILLFCERKNQIWTLV